MISFRFHVVSITAVFLALAVGVVVGSTYVDRAIVDGLQDRIDTVSANLDDRREQAEALDVELGEARAYAAASAPFAVAGRLDDTPVVVLALRGLDGDVVARAVELARQAGARVPGVVWVEPRWILDGDDDRGALTALNGEQGDRRQARTRAWAAVAHQFVEASEPGAAPAAGEGPDATSTTTTTGEPAEPSLVAGLVREGFLTLDPLGDSSTSLASLIGTSPRVLLLTGDRADTGLAPMLNVVAHATVGADLPTVVAEGRPEDDQQTRGARLASLDDATRTAATLVDDVDLAEGRVAAVLALARPTPGSRYGYGPGATSVLPDWTPP